MSCAHTTGRNHLIASITVFFCAFGVPTIMLSSTLYGLAPSWQLSITHQLLLSDLHYSHQDMSCSDTNKTLCCSCDQALGFSTDSSAHLLTQATAWEYLCCLHYCLPCCCRLWHMHFWMAGQLALPLPSHLLDIRAHRATGAQLSSLLRNLPCRQASVKLTTKPSKASRTLRASATLKYRTLTLWAWLTNNSGV